MSIKSHLDEIEREATAQVEAGSAIQRVLSDCVKPEDAPRFVTLARRALAHEPLNDEEWAFLRPILRRLRTGLGPMLALR